MDIQISETDLFLATSKFTDQETAKKIVSSVKGIVAAEIQTANSNLSTKVDLFAVKEDIQNLKAELKEDIFQLEARLSKSIYIVGLVQFVALAGTLISVMAYMLQIR